MFSLLIGLGACKTGCKRSSPVVACCRKKTESHLMISYFDCGAKKGTGFVFMLNAHMYSLINHAFHLSFLSIQSCVKECPTVLHTGQNLSY